MTPEELEEIQGIGPKMVETIRQVVDGSSSRIGVATWSCNGVPQVWAGTRKQSAGLQLGPGLSCRATLIMSPYALIRNVP